MPKFTIYVCDRCGSHDGAKESRPALDDPLGQFVLCNACEHEQQDLDRRLTAYAHQCLQAWRCGLPYPPEPDLP